MYIYFIKLPKQPGEMPKQLGNKTECGLLGFVSQLGGNYDKIRSQYPTEDFVKVYTFNSSRKMMSTVVRKPDGNYRLFSKGAPEMILDKYVV
jgi:Ca2+ transporting ATPase